MHLYRIAAQISLILSILNLVRAAPVRIVPEIPEASGEPPPSSDTVASPQHPPPLDGSPNSDTVPSPERPPSLDGSPEVDPPPSPQRPPSLDGAPDSDPVPSSQHFPSLDGAPDPNPVSSSQRFPSLEKAVSSGYPTPHLSSFSSESGNSWMLERPPRLSPGRPPSPYASASDKSLSSHYFSASDGLESSHDSIAEGSAPENTKFWTQKKLGFLLNVAIFGGLLTLWSLNLHSHPDKRDSDS